MSRKRGGTCTDACLPPCPSHGCLAPGDARRWVTCLAKRASRTPWPPRRGDAGIDPALLHIEAAICLARDRDTTEACRLAAATYLRIEAKHRTPIVEERAREVINALPPSSRSNPAVRDLTDVLALPAPR
ncbi:hypothetical protein WDH52_03630 [Streptomyces sp. TRM70308]|uniref:hypothetical protein n=1 Tax=Streptomyces sp. TRM70308 TaxID=3131932 RepID=UPI003CFF6AF8